MANLVREHAFDACTMLAWACVAPAVLTLVATTLGSVGMASTACVALAPFFRVVALRWLEGLPEAIRAGSMPALAHTRLANQVDLALGAATVGFALGATFGLLPAGSRWFYELLIGAWVVSSCVVLWLQVRLGERLTPQLVDPTELPGDKSALARNAIIAAAGLVMVSTFLATLRLALPATALAGTDAWLPALGAACYALSALAVLAACALCAVQALLLGQFVLACDALRTPVRSWNSLRERDDPPPDDESPEAIPPERRHAANPTKPDDDSPIPLA